jgi:hypothetical protein
MTVQQLNALAVIVILRRTHFPKCTTPEQLLDAVDSALEPYFGAIPRTSGEYSYMASIGCGTESQLTAEAFGGPQFTPLKAIYKGHVNAMYKSFTADELPTGLDIGSIGEFIFPENAALPDGIAHVYNRFKLRREIAAEYFDENHINSFKRSSQQKLLAEFVLSRAVSEDDFASLAQTATPRLFELLSTLADTRALDFAPNAVGRILGCQTAICRAPDRRDLFQELLLEESDRA